MENTKTVTLDVPLVDGTAKPAASPEAQVTRSEVIEDPGRLLLECQRWSIVAEGADRPMHHYSWLGSCISSFGGYSRPVFISPGGKDPMAVAPLVMRSKGVERLESLGVYELYEPTDFPHTDGASLRALSNAIAETSIPLFLRRVQTDSPVIDALRRAYRGRGLVITHPVAGCPWIRLDEGWTNPESKLGSRRRSSLKRARRNAEQFGPIQVEINCVSDSDLAEKLEEAFRIEASGWKGLSGTAINSDRTRRAFYEEYVKQAHRAGILRLCFLRIGDRSVAMQVAVECGGRFWLLKMGYDEEFSKCAPGNLLILETIKYAASRGLQSYEFLGTAGPCSQMWTDLVRPCVFVAAYPASVRGLLALTEDAFTFGVRRITRIFTEC